MGDRGRSDERIQSDKPDVKMQTLLEDAMTAALLLTLFPSSACASSLRPRMAPSTLRTQALPLLLLRGGRRRDCYAVEEAVGLFGNMRVPAALISGAIVPLATFAGPVVSKLDAPALANGHAVEPEPGLRPHPNLMPNPNQASAKRLHFLVAATALTHSLLSCLYATVAVSHLTESEVQPANSVVELLARDYELSWIGCNVCFNIGLSGLLGLVGLSGYIHMGAAEAFGADVLPPLACGVSAVILHALSIINDGVDSEGDMAKQWGRERAFGGTFAALYLRYIKLLLLAMPRRVLLAPTVALTLTCAVLLVQRLSRLAAATVLAAAAVAK